MNFNEGKEAARESKAMEKSNQRNVEPNQNLLRRKFELKQKMAFSEEFAI